MYSNTNNKKICEYKHKSENNYNYCKRIGGIYTNILKINNK